jgi:hypothetical protein
MVACMRWRTTSGPDWKFIEAVTEDGTRLYACRRSARPKARRSRSALRRSGWRSSSEMAQAWEQKEQHQQSVTSEPLIVCSGRTEPLWLQDGQRSGIRNSNCTHEPYQVSGQGTRDNGRQPLQFRCGSGVALAQSLAVSAHLKPRKSGRLSSWHGFGLRFLLSIEKGKVAVGAVGISRSAARFPSTCGRVLCVRRCVSVHGLFGPGISR